MVDYSITFARSARKELEALPDSVVQRIFPKIEASIDNNGKVIDIVAIRHRQDAYG